MNNEINNEIEQDDQLSRALAKTVGINIRAKRAEHHMTREELADKLNLSVSFVGCIERGDRGATCTTLYKLHRIFGDPIDSFFLAKEERGKKNIRFAEGKEDEDLRFQRKKISTLLADATAEELDCVIAAILLLKRAAKTTKADAADDIDIFKY